MRILHYKPRFEMIKKNLGHIAPPTRHFGGVAIPFCGAIIHLSGAMSDRTCNMCNTKFRDPSTLRRHMAKKKSCAPILDVTDLSEDDQKKAHKCRYCGRPFATSISMLRHVRQSCKIANTEEGMEQLAEHTLQRQLAEVKAQNEEQTTKIDELRALVQQMAQNIGHPIAKATVAQKQINVQNNITNVQTVVNQIAPWDGDRRIDVGIGHIVAAFAQNSRLKEYMRLGDRELTDPEIAPPYVVDLFMDLVKRAHADPAARNVYLNPRRADQALVHMRSGRWEVLPLAEATRLLFDGVAGAVHAVTYTNEERRQLPLEAQNALSLAGLLYEEEPDTYVKRAKAPMTAHLANVAPRLSGTGAPKTLAEKE